MLVATLEQERKKVYQAGREEGREEGMAKGLAKGLQAQRQILLRFVDWRFSLTEDQQTKLFQQLAKINELQQFSDLTNDALQSAKLEEFWAQVLKYLPLIRFDSLGREELHLHSALEQDCEE